MWGLQESQPFIEEGPRAVRRKERYHQGKCDNEADTVKGRDEETGASCSCGLLGQASPADHLPTGLLQ